MGEQLDPEMFKYLDLLADFDAVVAEPEWELLENLNQHEKNSNDSEPDGSSEPTNGGGK